MIASPEFAAAERELATALTIFNSARGALDTSLTQLGAREGAADRLIHHADEYGIDHTVIVLAKTPNTFEFTTTVPSTALPAIQTQLEAAYDAMHRVDLAMANRENLVRKGKPTHAKAILIGDKPYIFDFKADTLRNRDSGETVKADAHLVDTDSDGPSGKREQERDR